MVNVRDNNILVKAIANGTVTYTDGADTEDGALITAEVNSVEFSTVTLDGKYGYSPLFLVENANDGDVIEFFANGNKVAEYTFEDGATTQLNLVMSGKCGNAVCGGSEACSSCPVDCGACPSGGDSGGSGSGGGGGGGGGSLGAGYIASCIEKWECDEWSICSIDEVQRRTCKDNNKCGTIENKPAELRKCIYERVGGETIGEVDIQEEVVVIKRKLPVPLKDRSGEVNMLIVMTFTLFLVLVISTYKVMFKKKLEPKKKIQKIIKLSKLKEEYKRKKKHH